MNKISRRGGELFWSHRGLSIAGHRRLSYRLFSSLLLVGGNESPFCLVATLSSLGVLNTSRVENNHQFVIQILFGRENQFVDEGITGGARDAARATV
jgi:hypothetical protein